MKMLRTVHANESHSDGALLRAAELRVPYRILKEYHSLTGIPSVINTSFNMHEEPIVCTPADASRAFLQGNLDHLAIGPFLVAHLSSRGGHA